MSARGPASSGSHGAYTPDLRGLRAHNKCARETVSREKFARPPQGIPEAPADDVEKKLGFMVSAKAI